MRCRFIAASGISKQLEYNVYTETVLAVGFAIEQSFHFFTFANLFSGI
ncbi:MAG: hypothetical protein LBJ00_02765 [Planctomycetaceae bacterium]|nr:hypothetical protein [Planctomycetaceae bacterium]